MAILIGATILALALAAVPATFLIRAKRKRSQEALRRAGAAAARRRPGFTRWIQPKPDRAVERLRGTPLVR